MAIKGVRQIYLVITDEEPESIDQVEAVCKLLSEALPGEALVITTRSPVSLPMLRVGSDGTSDTSTGETLLMSLMDALLDRMRELGHELLKLIDAKLGEINDKMIN